MSTLYATPTSTNLHSAPTFLFSICKMYNVYRQLEATEVPVVSYEASTYYVGVPFNVCPSVTGVVEVWAIDALDASMSFDASTGCISGTPTVTGTPQSVVTATNIIGSATVDVAFVTENPQLTYVASLSLTVGTAMSKGPQVKPSGSFSAFSVSPDLPAGLSIGGSSGVISGNPTVVAAATDYEITATNSYASVTQTISITVAAPAFTVTYPVSIVAYAGVPFSTTPTLDGTAVSFNIAPPLPAGLTLDTQTGKLSGVATSASPATSYTVSSTDTFGTVASVVFDVAIELITVSYAGVNNFPLAMTKSVTPIVVPNTPGICQFSISPALPSGLVFSTATGEITGKASAETPAAAYQVDCTPAGVAPVSATFAVAVVLTAPAALTYATPLATYSSGVPISNNVPAFSGVITQFTISPSLPEGLVIDGVTGVISGAAPSSLTSPLASYVVDGYNSIGYTSVTIKIAVMPLPPSGLSYKDGIYSIGNVIPNNVPTLVGGATGFTLNPINSAILPAGLSFDLTTGIISGVPLVVVTAPQFFTVTASNPSGSTTSPAFFIIVKDRTIDFTLASTTVVVVEGHVASLSGSIVGAPVENVLFQSNVGEVTATTGTAFWTWTLQEPLMRNNQIVSINATTIAGVKIVGKTQFTLIVNKVMPTLVISRKSTKVLEGQKATVRGTALDSFSNLPTVTASRGQITPDAQSKTFTWRFATTSTSESGAFSISALDKYGNAKTENFAMLVVNAPPELLTEYTVVTPSPVDGKLKCTGTFNDNDSASVSIEASMTDTAGLQTPIGSVKIDFSRKTWSWTLDDIKKIDNTNSEIAVTATDRAGAKTTLYFFAAASNEVKFELFDVVYQLVINTPLASLSDDDIESLKIATGVVLGIDHSMVVISSGSRRMRNLAMGDSVDIAVQGVTQKLGNKLAAKVVGAVKSNLYTEALLQTSFSPDIAQVQIASEPLVRSVSQRPKPTNDAACTGPLCGLFGPSIPYWAVISVLSFAGLILLICIFKLTSIICRTSKTRRMNESLQGVAITHPKGASPIRKPQSPITQKLAIASGKSPKGVTIVPVDVRPKGVKAVPVVPAVPTLQPAPIQAALTPAKAVATAAVMAAAPVPVTNTKQSIYFRMLPSGESVSVDVDLKERVSSVKRKLGAVLPQGSEILILLAGKALPDDASLESLGCFEGTTLHVVAKAAPSKAPAKAAALSESTKTVEAPMAAPVKSEPSKHVLQIVLQGLSKRSDPDIANRRKARASVLAVGTDEEIRNAVLGLMNKTGNLRSTEPLSKPGLCWLPVDTAADPNEMFAIGAAKEWQSTKNYVLVGNTATVGASKIQQGLIRPLNMKPNGSMEGVNSIVWQATVGPKKVVIKGLLPFNNMEGYTSQFDAQDAEYKIPFYMSTHPNIVPILHHFTGSSVLVYPWISEELRNLNDELSAIGKRFIRHNTTYIVMEYYPKTLKAQLLENTKKGKSLGERELCLYALQLLEAVAHMNKHKVVHRDIKDDNIFIANDGRLVLADFGCAIACGDMKYQRVADLTDRIGTPSSIAPEVHDAIKKGPEATDNSLMWDVVSQNDTYAVGVLLYNMLAVTLPSSTGPEFSASDIPSLDEKTISPGLNLVLRSLVSYDPTCRATATEALLMLQILLWGPPRYICNSVSEVRKFMLERRLDLLFNCCDASTDKESIGRIQEFPKSWPLPMGVERSMSEMFYQNITDIEGLIGASELL